MKSYITEHFRKRFQNLPSNVQYQARKAYRMFRENPSHPGLRFKPVHPSRPIYSVRINRDYRALGVQVEGEMIWFWIGSHTDYEKRIETRSNF